VIHLTVIGIPSLTTSKVILFYAGIFALEKKKVLSLFELLSYIAYVLLQFVCLVAKL